MQVVFSIAICLGQTKPADFGELEYDNIPHESRDSHDSDEKDDNLKDSYGGNIYDTGIFTKYPESPTDDGYDGATDSRRKRNASENSSDGEHEALDVNQLFFDKVYNESRPERRSDEKKDEIPLRGLISAIETELVDSADKINSDVSNREQRSAETTPQTQTEKSDDDDDSIDVNKNFFAGIFEFTRAQREATNENITNKTIPLKGLVDAVESTLINSAQKLQTAAATKNKSTEKVERISAVDTEAKERKTRSVEEDDDAKEVPEGKSHFAVEKVYPTKNLNLDLLKPIAIKTPENASSESHESSESSESNESCEVVSTTTATPVQPTSLTVVHESNSTHIIPNANTKTVHVQRQQISETIFHSTLAILPTISPNNINVQAIAATTTATATTQTSTTETVDAVTDKVDSTKQLNENKVSDKRQELKEKFAEVAANPVILTSAVI